MSNLLDAYEDVNARWRPLFEEDFGPLKIDESLTERHPWGWVIYLVKETEDGIKTPKARCLYDRISGNSLPVGSRGLKSMILTLQEYREIHGFTTDMSAES